MKIKNNDAIKAEILEVAKRMLIAVNTAPKGRGRNTLNSIILEGKDLNELADKTEEIGIATNQQFFIRDANNLRKSEAVVLIGTKVDVLGLSKCGYCGLSNCANKQNYKEIPCTFNTIDLGIAIGSAISIAADNRVDNRVMYSIGYAAKQMEIFSKEYTIVIAIPLSASVKNIYFDR